MLSWLFKKRGDSGAPSNKMAPPPAPTVAPPPAVDKAKERSRQIEEARAAWQPRLQAARGDDPALLEVAQGTPVLEIKLAAVEAMTSEETLRKAERAFRSHDRRVHQLAKQRLQSAMAQRSARTKAQALIDAAGALVDDEQVPVNRLVELDRDWQGLDRTQVDPEQQERFTTLRARIDATLRAADLRKQQCQRWSAEAADALAALQAAWRAAAAGQADLGAARIHAESLLQARPDVDTLAATEQSLRAALAMADAVQARLDWLAAPPAPVAELDDDTAAGQWQALAVVSDGEAARTLEQRFVQWQHERRPQPDPVPEPVVAEPPPPVVEAKGPSVEQLRALEALLEQGEAALADGQLGALAQHLEAIDQAVDTMDGPLHSTRLRARRQALQAEHARLRGWQSWGGGRARDALVEEAEALARTTAAATAAAADPATPNNAPKLQIKPHADAIQSLRKRWKELDRLGAAASQTLWARFDAALKLAYEPVAAQQSAIKAVREENLAARQALLATLEAVPGLPETASADELAAHWKEQIRALDQFRAAWRQLGPLEHTVPAAARAALQERLRVAVDRVEAPLQEARRLAEIERERLIAAAEAMAQEIAQSGSARDVVPRTRELQAQWQQQARMLPLPRGVEGALWTRFRAATDKLFKAREDLFSAREAELASHLNAREALIQQLQALAADTPTADVQRTLAEVDRAWRQAPEMPRNAAAALESRYRDARAAWEQALAERGHQRWLAQFDTLSAKLALCRQREAAEPDLADLNARWSALGALPPAWDKPLAQRWSQPAGSGPLDTAAVDETLLQLEASLDMPADEASQAARRDLKLRAMKEALEGRLSPKAESARRNDWMGALLRQGGLCDTQQQRLAAIIEHLRQQRPDTR